jgi:GNAT superfamily N-acetyltransferase
MRWTIRNAEAGDAAALAALIDEFAVGHPAADVKRPAETLAPHFFGPDRIGNVVLAEGAGRALGFAVWRKTFDTFWFKQCGEVTELFVRPAHRGLGVAATLIAFVCAEIRKQGGAYMCGFPSEVAAQFLDRFAIGYPSRWYHVSERAFHSLADLAGADVRTLVRVLPGKSWNRERVPGSLESTNWNGGQI